MDIGLREDRGDTELADQEVIIRVGQEDTIRADRVVIGYRAAEGREARTGGRQLEVSGRTAAT